MKKNCQDFDSRLLQIRDFSSRLFPRDRRDSRPRPGPSFRDQEKNSNRVDCTELMANAQTVLP